MTATSHHAQHHVGRLAVTLNIGLVGNPYSGLPQALRAKAYAGDIAEILAGGNQWSPVTDTVLLLQSFWPASDTPFPGVAPIKGLATAWSERVTENSDVITFDIIRGAQAVTATPEIAEQIVSALVHRLALTLSQEAIAVTWVDEGARDIAYRIHGEGLYGPNALAWGDFKPSYFQRFLPSALSEAARFPAPAKTDTVATAPAVTEGHKAA